MVCKRFKHYRSTIIIPDVTADWHGYLMGSDVWSIRSMNYTFQTDLFSGMVSSTGICQWDWFKPNPNATATLASPLDSTSDVQQSKDSITTTSTPISTNATMARDNEGGNGQVSTVATQSLLPSLLVEENRRFQACLQEAKGGRDDDAHRICVQSVVDYECQHLGPICDLPQDYLSMMSLGADDQKAVKNNIQCAQSCSNSHRRG